MTAKFTFLYLVLFFLAPFIYLIFYFNGEVNLDYYELGLALYNSVIQGLSVALISITIGFFGSFFILNLTEYRKRLMQKICFIPIVLPSLFTILIAFTLIKPFPMGTLGIIIVLSLIHIGYAASLFSQIFEKDIFSFLPVSLVYGFSKFQFYKIIIIKNKKYVLFLALTILINTITAFTVPLIVSGGRSRNLEILIYEKMFTEQNWVSALVLGFIQQLIIGFSLYKLSRVNLNMTRNTQSVIFKNHINKFQLIVMNYIFLFYIFIYGCVYVYLFLNSIRSEFIWKVFNYELFQAFLGSVLFSLMNLFLFLAVLIKVLYLIWHNKSIKFIDYFNSVSVLLLGASLFFWGTSQYYILNLLALSYFFSVALFSAIYKLTIQAKIHELESQKLTAKIYGLCFFDYLKLIFFPQMRNSLDFLVSTLFIMSIAEFALIKISGSTIKTLGTIMASYLSSYRIEGAFVVSLIMLLLWFFMSLLFSFLLNGGKIDFFKKSRI